MDYLSTSIHFLEDRDRIQAEAEFERWIDSFTEEPLPTPTCSLCSSFIPDRAVKTLTGEDIVSPSHCKARALADLPPFKKAVDPACELFNYDCPF